jgi:hypothetical protein
MKTGILLVLVGSLLMITNNLKSIDFSGNYTIGATGTYTNLTSLANALKTASGNSVTGDCYFEIQSDYSTASEAFPIVFYQFTNAGSFQITIRPKSGVSAVLTEGSSTTAIISIDGGDNYNFDGRAAGIGSSVWTIRNTKATSTYGAAIRLLNGATYNTLTYLTLETQNAATNSGNIVIASTTNTTGNSYNTISYCQIRNRSDISGTSHNIGLYASGNATYQNTNNTIENCEFFNHFRATASTYGIYIVGGNTGFTIANNKIYQPATLTYTTGTVHMGIRVNNSNGNAFTISGNSIGYASNAGTGVYTMEGIVANRFAGIYLTLGKTTTSSVQSNKIAGISLTTTSTTNNGYGAFSGIYITEGRVNIGNINANIIGDSSSTGNIEIEKEISSTSLTLVNGIACVSTSTVNISNNSIGGISLRSSYAESSMSFIGITCSGTNGNFTIGDNKIGSFGTDHNIQLGENGVTTGAGKFIGIYNSATGTISANENAISNITNYCSGDNYVLGMNLTSGICTVNENQIFDIISHSSRTGNSTGPAIGGIIKSSTVAGIHTINQNKVYNLHCAHATANNYVVGIYFNGPVNNSHEIARNLVYNLTTSTNSTSSYIYGLYVNGGAGKIERNYIHSLSTGTISSRLYGIQIAGGNMNIENNRIRLGIDGNGNSLTTAINIYGIYKSSTLSNNFYHNTVYIGGTGVGTTTTNTMAFYRSVNTTVDEVKNNIFVNNRSNSTTGGKHFCYVLNGTNSITVDYNLYQASGTGGNLASVNNGTTARATLISTRENFNGQDLHSGYGAPSFINATGNISTLDLNLTGTTPAEASGVTTGVSVDFNGDVRSGLSPIDMGSDAGNFTESDIFTPNISFNPLSNTTSTADRVLSNVSITDIGAGVITSGAYKPAIWYRRSSGTPSAWVSNTGTLTSGDETNGLWSFTLDYSKISGGVAINDIIQYYIVAQDLNTPANIWYSPFIGALHTDVISQTTAPTTPKSYTISGSYLSGTYTVGSGGSYPSLTGAGGFFETVNSATLDGDITLEIISDLTETGVNALNVISTDGQSRSISIKPNSTTVRTISGTYNGFMIRLNGADSVYFDGRYSGSGNYIKILNKHTTAATGAIAFLNGACKNKIQYCTILGGKAQHNILFSTTSASSGNNYNLLDNNIIGNRSTDSIPTYGIYSNGTGTEGLENTENIISNNKIYNFITSGVYLGATGNGNNWIINANHFYNNLATAPNAAQYPIYIASSNINNCQITNNFIGGQAESCGGDQWENSGAVNFYAIYISNLGSSIATIIDNNIISNIRLTSIAGATFIGIYKLTGLANIGTTNGNIIGSPTTASSIIIDGTGTLYGIRSEAGISEIKQNIIANIEQTSASLGSIHGVYINSTNETTIEKNKIYKIGSLSSITSANSIFGIRFANSASAAGYYVYNNQIALGQNSNSTSQAIYGIYIANGSGGEIKIYNNSLYITGTASASTYRSTGIFKNSSTNLSLQNNIFHIDRNGNSSQNLALIFANTGGTIVSDYNLLITPNTAEIVRWSSTNYSFAGYQTASSKDKNSWSEITTNVSSASLFANASSCDLSINNDNVESWLANGNGIALTEVSTDFAGNSRYSEIANGATDIGAFEFDASISNEPGIAVQTGTIAVGNTTTYALGGRTVATIEWNSGTALPTTIEVQYFSGVPANIPSTAPMYSHTIITQTGGTDFNYDLVLPFSDALVGLIDNPNEISIAKSEDNENWQEQESSVNYTARTIRISNLNSFSYFNVISAGDLEEGALPVEMLSFEAELRDEKVHIKWITASELNNDHFEIQKSDDLNLFETIGQQIGNGSTNTLSSYLYVDENPLKGINYYRLASIDYDGTTHFTEPISILYYEIGIQIYNSENGIELISTVNTLSQFIIEIYEISGKLMFTETFIIEPFARKKINLSELSKGIYFVKIADGNKIQTLKFVK